MKLNLSTLIAAAAAAAIALPALALAPNAVPAANKLFVGGSTATNPAVGRLWLEASGGGCGGSVDVYTTAADPGGTADARLGAAFAGTDWAILCVGNGTIGANIGYYKESNGGSGNGVGPVVSGNLTFLDIGNGATPPAPCASGGSMTGTGLLAATVWFGCTLTTPLHPDAGLSDVNPELLNTDTNVTGQLTASALVTVVFSPAVSLNLYRAMQRASGLQFNCAIDADANGIPDCDEPANVPSFTPSQLRALFTQFTASWGDLRTDANVALNAVNPPGRDTVFICRRGNTSGTEATFEALLLNQRCTSGVQGMALPDVIATLNGGTAWNAGHINETVFAANNSGSVASCLAAHDANNDWAIGVISTETLLTSIGGNGGVGPGAFRYPGINRANPDLLSVVSGNYELWTDSTWNVKTVPGLAGTKKAISDWLVGNFGTEVPNVDAGLRHVTGDGGLLSEPFAPNAPPLPPFNVASVRANPTNTASHAPLGATNNCNPPITFAVPTELGGEHEEQNTSGETP